MIPVVLLALAYAQQLPLGGIPVSSSVPAPVTIMSESLLPNNTDCNSTQCQVNASGTVIYHLADPSIAGDSLIMFLTASPNGGSCAVVGGDITDDGSNTWVAGPSGTQATDSQSAYIFYVLNAAAGTYVVTFHNAHCGTNYTTGVQITIVQFKNIATSSAADGSSCSSGSSTTPSSGSFTPAVNGGLIVSYAFRTNSQPNNTTWTPGSGFTPYSEDTRDGTSVQYQVQGTAGAINPDFTMGSTSRWVSCAMAFKQAVSGSGVPAGIHVVGIYHHTSLVKGSSTSQAFQIPCRGNLLVAEISGNNAWLVNSITDTLSSTWQNTGSQLQNSSNPNGASEGAQTWYVKNISCPSTYTVTVVFNSTSTGHGGIVFYDIVNSNTSAPLDGDFTTTNDGSCCYQNDPAGTALASAPSGITPNSSPTLLICEIPVQYNTVLNITNVTGALFDASTYTGENVSGPEPLDQNNGWMHVNLASTSTQSVTWAQKFTSGGDPAFRGYVVRCNTWK